MEDCLQTTNIPTLPKFLFTFFNLADPINDDEVIGYQGGAGCDGYDVAAERSWCYVSK